MSTRALFYIGFSSGSCKSYLAKFSKLFNTGTDILLARLYLIKFLSGNRFLVDEEDEPFLEKKFEILDWPSTQYFSKLHATFFPVTVLANEGDLLNKKELA